MSDYIEVQVRCPFCGKVTTVNEVTDEEYQRIRSRTESIQNIVPHLSAEKRELLMTGICLECQRSVFDE